MVPRMSEHGVEALLGLAFFGLIILFLWIAPRQACCAMPVFIANRFSQAKTDGQLSLRPGMEPQQLLFHKHSGKTPLRNRPADHKLLRTRAKLALIVRNYLNSSANRTSHRVVV